MAGKAALYPAEDLYPSESLYPSDGTPTSRIAVTREFPPDRVAVRIKDPSTGQTIARWAEDEPRAENVISGLRKSGDMPGGHKEMTGSLARDPRRDYPDLTPYMDVELEQPGGENIWEGRLAKAPESDGERMAIEPAAVGHREALEDRKGLRFGFIDRDQSRWGGMSVQRKINYLATPRAISDAGSFTDATTGEPSLETALEGAWTDLPRCEGWYDSNGIPIGAVMAAWKKAGTVDAGAEGWSWKLVLSADDIATAPLDESANLRAAEPSNVLVEASDDSKRFAFVQFTFNAAGGTSGRRYSIYWTPVVIGDQGLGLQGSWPEVGFTAKQMLEFAVPEYTYLEVTDESIEDDGFVIPQAWFAEPTDMATVVKELTKYALYDWFVLRGKLLEVREPGTYGRRWRAYAGPSELKEAGLDGSRLWRDIVVRWQDVDGTTKTAGPPGSGTTVESSGLEISDPDHPAVRAGIRREDVLDLGGVSESVFAIETGERWLKDANELSRSGEATLRGYILDDKGILRPVGQVQPGDEISFPDAGGGTDYRKIVQADYDHPSRASQVTLDAPKESVQALLERYRAALSARGIA